MIIWRGRPLANDHPSPMSPQPPLPGSRFNLADLSRTICSCCFPMSRYINISCPAVFSCLRRPTSSLFLVYILVTGSLTGTNPNPTQKSKEPKIDKQPTQLVKHQTFHRPPHPSRWLCLAACGAPIMKMVLWEESSVGGINHLGGRAGPTNLSTASEWTESISFSLSSHIQDSTWHHPWKPNLCTQIPVSWCSELKFSSSIS